MNRKAHETETSYEPKRLIKRKIIEPNKPHEPKKHREPKRCNELNGLKNQKHGKKPHEPKSIVNHKKLANR